MSGQPIRRATSALLLVGLLAALGVLPVPASRAAYRPAPGSDHVVIGVDSDGTPVIRAAGARRLALAATASTSAPDLAPALVRVDVHSTPIVRTAGRQFDARIASRGPPHS